MSEQHAKALLKLRREVGAVIEAAEAAREGRTSGTLSHTAAEFHRAIENAERTYYVRLCADVEAMIYIHLGDHFRYDGLPAEEFERERVTADNLLEAVRFRLRPATNQTIPNELMRLREPSTPTETDSPMGIGRGKHRWVWSRPSMIWNP